MMQQPLKAHTMYFKKSKLILRSYEKTNVAQMTLLRNCDSMQTFFAPPIPYLSVCFNVQRSLT